jgi:hypothetical protein
MTPLHTVIEQRVETTQLTSDDSHVIARDLRVAAIDRS